MPGRRRFLHGLLSSCAFALLAAHAPAHAQQQTPRAYAPAHATAPGNTKAAPAATAAPSADAAKSSPATSTATTPETTPATTPTADAATHATTNTATSATPVTTNTTNATTNTPAVNLPAPSVNASAQSSPSVAAAPASVAPDAPSFVTSAAASDAPASEPSPAAEPQPQPTPPVCVRTVSASVVALAQPYMLNRLGASMPNALIFALEEDVDMTRVQLKPYRRARPLVLRANVGDCLRVTLKNRIYQYPTPQPSQPFGTPPPVQNDPWPIPSTSEVSLHAQGLNVTDSIDSDGSFVGVNNSALASSPQCRNTAGKVVPCVRRAGQAPTPTRQGETRIYNLYAQREGSFLLYSQGNTNTTGQHIDYLAIDQLASGLMGSVNVQPAGAQWFRSQVTQADMALAVDKTKGNNGYTPLGQPIINYDAVYPAGHPFAGKPILNMLDGANNLRYADLTAIVTGPNHGRFPGTTGVNNPEPPCSAVNDPAVRSNPAFGSFPTFCANPAAPDRKQPYREITVFYHEVSNATQAFPVFSAGNPLAQTVGAGMDAFAVNYGTGGIAAEIYANRIGVGPMANCVDCKFEEFFLSSWTVGDPAMIVDVPANYTPPATPAAPPCTPQTLTNGTCQPAVAKDPPAGQRATRVFYPEDPSNVFHSYLNDHVKFRILHGGNGVTHVHHQHAQQWLQTPNSDKSTSLDSQMISPGASYTLEIMNGGSGNLNKTSGDSIFHCHFYPHFAGGMWGHWRVHDVFEAGTVLDSNGRPATGWNRALPDGEIRAGVPIPAVVPMPTLALAPMPARVKVCSIDNTYDPTKLVATDCPVVTGKVIGSVAVVNSADVSNGLNPGFPFFIPGIAGSRAPHPPFDFAPVLDPKTNQPVPGSYMDGGLPRHVVTGGRVSNEQHTLYDWSKDFDILNAVQLPESGTAAEQAAMSYHGTRQHQSFAADGSTTLWNGQPANFITNGLPRKPPQYPAQNQFGSQLGAPFADPGINRDGTPAGGATPTRYKTAAFQLDVTLNTYGWHYPQQRIMALWKDVIPTINFVYPPSDTSAPRRAPEPLFFRVNSGDVVELWHTNLVPNYYTVDDFQVRTPTDIIGQHIHLVQFDVMSADGAANGYNYEDGTFSPGEVQELVHAINKGTWNGQPNPGLALKPPPADIIDCAANPSDGRCTRWAGAQTTVQRWYAAPLLDSAPQPNDRTIGTVFTHDHFGPSTHQQTGLYGGLIVEPPGSVWRDAATGNPFGGDQIAPPRTDGGPTSWQANITFPANPALNFREFALEFQDFQLAYTKYAQTPSNYPSADPSVGYRNTCLTPTASSQCAPITNAVNPPSTPSILSSGSPPGTMSINYRNEPVPYRIPQPPTLSTADLASVFDSTFRKAPNGPPNGDPTTPILRAYQNENVMVRVLVGAHQLAHFFTINGMRWLSERAWGESGFRSTQAMGISEHFELSFTVPPSSAQVVKPCPDDPSGACAFADYLYLASAGDNGVSNGLWGIFRAYSTLQPARNLSPLWPDLITPNDQVTYATCPQTLAPPAQVRNYQIVATTAAALLPNGALTYNDRGLGNGTGSANSQLLNPFGLVYVRAQDVGADGKLKCLTDAQGNCQKDAQGNTRYAVPNFEPLILRANAGDCVVVTLKNNVAPDAAVLKQQYQLQAPFNIALANNQNLKLMFSPSRLVGLRPQLLSYDTVTSGGHNIGYNTWPNQAVPPGGTATYTWYAGIVGRQMSPTGRPGAMSYTPVEFGSLNLLPADPLLQHINGLYGAMVVEPAGSTWTCDGRDAAGNPKQVDCDSPASGDSLVSRASATVTPPQSSGAAEFREFVMMMNEDNKMQVGPSTSQNVANAQSTFSAVNYRSEPTFYRFGQTGEDVFSSNGDNSCSVSNALVMATAGQPATAGDPRTPVYSARAGQPVRFRMLHPPGSGIAQVFTLNGHVWQRNPYLTNSLQMGDNPLSQWMGSLDNHGSTTHYDILLDQAGGPYRVPGDYLYTAFVPAKSQLGLWGIFRVLDANGAIVSGKPACAPAPAAAPRPTPTPAPTRPAPARDRLEQFRIKPGTQPASRP